MQKEKSQYPSQRTARHADPEPPLGKATRSTVSSDAGTLGSKGKETLATLKESRAQLNSVSTAKKWLTKEELLIEGEDITTSSLAQALLWIAAGERNMADQLVDGIRAVALCLDACSLGEVVDVAMCEFKETAALWVGEAKSLVQKAVDEVVDAAKKKVSESSQRSWADEVNEGFQGQGTVGGYSHPAPSFAQAVAAGTRRPADQRGELDADYLAGEALKRRRVLIDGIEGVGNAAGGLSPKEIVEKANIALTAARIGAEGSGTEPSTDPKAVSAKVLENGGVILELETEESAAWLLDSGVRTAFESNFGGSARIVEQLFHVVANFLPVTLRDTLQDFIPSIVRNNCITTDSLVKCRWLKAPKYWKEEQRFAHAVLSFNKRANASRIIQQGIVIEGQRFKAKKMEEVPRRCFKCQRIGHLASNCKEISAICPNCARAHTGEECRADANRYRCINCSKMGRPANHASWDHACPSMEVEKKKRAMRNPDSQYRYFPTDEVWTWAKRDMYSDEEAQGVGMKWTGRAGGNEFVRRADKGWKGMRDQREAEAARREEEWTMVGARRNRDSGT